MKWLLLLLLVSGSVYGQTYLRIEGGVQVVPPDSVIIDTAYNEVSWLVQKDTAHYWDAYNQNNVLKNRNIRWKQVAPGWRIIMKDYIDPNLYVVDGIEMILTDKKKLLMTIIYRLDINKQYFPGNWIIRSDAQPRWGF